MVYCAIGGGEGSQIPKLVISIQEHYSVGLDYLLFLAVLGVLVFGDFCIDCSFSLDLGLKSAAVVIFPTCATLATGAIGIIDGIDLITKMA